jgi:hypothetical protein
MSIFLRTTGLTKFSTKSSATFDTTDVNEMGHTVGAYSRLLQVSVLEEGQYPLLSETAEYSYLYTKDSKSLLQARPASRSAFSFRTQLGIPSGPLALAGFTFDNFIKTSCSVTVKPGSSLPKSVQAKSHSLRGEVIHWRKKNSIDNIGKMFGTSIRLI